MTQTLPVLYSFRRCPYAMRARYALYIAKIPHEHREVDLKNKPQDMLDISPKGTVPVLQLENGMVLEESLDIMKWVFKDVPLSERDEQFIKENDTTFKKALDRYKYPGRYPEEDGKDYREICELFLRKIEDELNPFLSGEEITLVDIALFPFVRQFVKVDPNWFEEQPYPNIKKWIELMSQTPVFEHIMHPHDAWMPSSSPLFIFCDELKAQ